MQARAVEREPGLVKRRSDRRRGRGRGAARCRRGSCSPGWGDSSVSARLQTARARRSCGASASSSASHLQRASIRMALASKDRRKYPNLVGEKKRKKTPNKQQKRVSMETIHSCARVVSIPKFKKNPRLYTYINQSAPKKDPLN